MSNLVLDGQRTKGHARHRRDVFTTFTASFLVSRVLSFTDDLMARNGNPMAAALL